MSGWAGHSGEVDVVEGWVTHTHTHTHTYNTHTQLSHECCQNSHELIVNYSKKLFVCDFMMISHEWVYTQTTKLKWNRCKMSQSFLASKHECCQTWFVHLYVFRTSRSFIIQQKLNMLWINNKTHCWLRFFREIIGNSYEITRFMKLLQIHGTFIWLCFPYGLYWFGLESDQHVELKSLPNLWKLFDRNSVKFIRISQCSGVNNNSFLVQNRQELHNSS